MTAADEPIQQSPNMGCGILGRYPILSVVTFAAVGVGFGILLSEWNPDNAETKNVILTWVGLLGDLFIRALKAVVLPLVFVNVAVSVVDMMMLGRASAVGVTTVVLYTTTTLIASTIGLISILAFQGLFKEGDFDESTSSLVQLGCTAPGSLLTEDMTTGSLMCVPEANASSPYTQFEIIDLTAGLATTGSSFTELSMSETIYDGVFMKLITDNVFYSFVDGNFASVVIFAIVFGISLGKIMFEKGQDNLTGSYVVSFFQEISDILIKIINWIIALTPLAVLSLITNAIGSQEDLSSAFSNVGYLLAANLTGFAAHILITDIGFFYLVSGLNPIKYLSYIVPAQTTAFACASSAATLPVTLRCVKSTGVVPDDIRNFVCPLGATINMDGSAIYFPCACIWLAILNGINPDAGSYILLIILSTVGSAGTAPVPSAALVMVLTAYNTVFGTSGVPNGFEFVVAIDWFLDRCITSLNVTGDAVVAGIVAARTGLKVEEDEDPETTKRTKAVEDQSSSEEHVEA